jgi:hypothetical protein
MPLFGFVALCFAKQSLYQSGPLLASSGDLRSQAARAKGPLFNFFIVLAYGDSK